MQYSNPYSNPYSNHYSKILESGLESANENTLNTQNSEIITDSKDYENYGSKMSSEYTRLGFIGDNIYNTRLPRAILVTIWSMHGFSRSKSE